MADERLARLMGTEDLRRLQSCCVICCGTGNLGGPVQHHLGVLGVSLIISDPGRVRESNLANQFFPASRLGDPKAFARADQLREQRPTAKIYPIAAPFETLGLGVFARADLIVGGLDNRVGRVRLAAISQKVGVPYLDLAVDGSGEHLYGTVTFYDPRTPNAACHACRYDAEQLNRIRSEGRGPGCPSWRDAGAPITEPTIMGTPFAGSLAGFGAIWSERALLGRGDEFAGKQLQVRADGKIAVRTVELKRSPSCRLGHRRLDPIHSVPAGTIRELFDRATRDLSAAPARLQLHDRTVVTRLRCTTGPCEKTIPRLVEAFTEHDVSCKCHDGAEMVPAQIGDQLSAEEVMRHGAVSWQELGLPHADVVTAVTSTGDEVHYVVGGADAAAKTLTRWRP